MEYLTISHQELLALIATAKTCNSMANCAYSTKEASQAKNAYEEVVNRNNLQLSKGNPLVLTSKEAL